MHCAFGMYEVKSKSKCFIVTCTSSHNYNYTITDVITISDNNIREDIYLLLLGVG